MATYIIAGILLILIALAGRYVIKNRNRHACCGGSCGNGCNCGKTAEKPNPPGYDYK